MPETPKLTPYQIRLFVFLSVATFFEGYDLIALTQILPNLRADMGIDEASAGLLVGFINVGTVVAYLLVRHADRVGRRKVLTITIAGYTLFTFLSGLAPSVYFFAIAQLLARVFLIGEWCISMVIAAEEFPAARRGMVLGVVQGFSSLGSIACAGVVPLLLETSYGWRSVYFVGIIPLAFFAFARRGLRETKRFAEQGAAKEARSMTAIFKTPYKKRVLQLGLIWFLTYLCTQNAITFWKEFAVGERGMTDGDVAASITIAAVASMPMVFAVGRLLDFLGRRKGAAVVFVVTALGVLGAYSLHGKTALTAALVFAIFGVSAVLPVLNAYTTELFPTEQRADAFAWSNNLLGRIGYVLSPVLVGAIAHQTSWGFAVSLTAIFPFLALGLILLTLPETGSRELEETSRI